MSTKFKPKDASTPITAEWLNSIEDLRIDTPPAIAAVQTNLTNYINSLAASGGSSLVGFTQGVTGAVPRTVQAKNRDRGASLKDFGAIGDGVANDSAAILLARDYISATGQDVFVPPGTYLTDPFQLSPTSYANEGSFYGLDRERTIIKRRTNGAGVFITIGNALATLFQSGLVISGLTFDGGLSSNGDTLLCYDLVRSRFENCAFTGGADAVHLLGGISVTFDSCIFSNAAKGFQAQKFTSAAGGGWPNLIKLLNCEVVDNSEYAVWFDNGRMLVLDNTQLEGNGTVLGAATGGIYIGPNIGEEVAITDTFSMGLVASNCWFEANKGTADVTLNSGINAVYDSNFFSTALQVTNDVLVNGGRYLLKNVNMSFSKASNVLENAGSIAGNIIESSDIPNVNANSAKTTVIGDNKIRTQGGTVPVFSGLTIPYEQFGNSNTVNGATTHINFAVPFSAVPKIFAQVHNGDSSTTILQIVISNISASGFDVRCLSLTSGSSSITSVVAGFNWRAVGTL